jgi:hypothetical protein
MITFCSILYQPARGGGSPLSDVLVTKEIPRLRSIDGATRGGREDNLMQDDIVNIIL